MILELPDLYPHQEELRDRTRKSLAKWRRVILTAPPGMGKTRTAKWIIGASALREPAENQTGRSLFAVQKRGLVDNASDSFKEEPALPHGVVMSGVKPAWHHRVQVASIDTLLSWFIEGGEYDTNVTFDLIVYDETHSHLPKLKKFLDHHDRFRADRGLHPAFVIGLTATPQAKGLGDIYREIVEGPATQWLIDEGYLSPFRYFRATQGDLGKLVRRGGEFTKDSVCEAMKGLSGDLVRDWKQFADGRPTVGFFPRRSHAQEARDLLEEAGLRVDYIDGETPDNARHRIFWELNNGKLDYLCNVQVVERGTDIPRIGCVQLCVAIGSLTRYRQMIGRGSRIHPEKTDCIILDHGANILRHGFFEDDPGWSLDQSRADDGEVNVRPTVECPECQAIYRGGRCRNCGYEPTKKELKSQGLEWDGEELREVKKTDKQRTGQNAHDLMVSTMFRAGKSGRSWKQCVGMFYGENRKQHTNYRVPKTVTVGGHQYYMVRYGDPRCGDRVSHLYPFTKGGKHGGDFYIGPV